MRGTAQPLASYAYLLAHEVSESVLHLDQSSQLHKNQLLSLQVTDSAVSALAHVSSNHASVGGGYFDNLSAIRSVAGARECLNTVRAGIESAVRRQLVSEAEAAPLIGRIVELLAVLMALNAELHRAIHGKVA